MLHLRVDVLQRRQSRTSRVTVVPAHQWQPAHEQVLTNLKWGQCENTMIRKINLFNLVTLKSKWMNERWCFNGCKLLLCFVKRHMLRANERWCVCVIPPPQQQKQSLCLPAGSDRGKPLRLWALKGIGPQREMSPRSRRLRSKPLFLIWSEVTLTLCIGVPSSTKVSHHLTGGQMTVKVLIRKKPVTCLLTVPYGLFLF